VHGQLVLFGHGCRARLLSLPSLEQKEDSSGCLPRGAVSPDGSLMAQCVGDETELSYAHSTSPALHSVVPGCAPAWRPDGVLTVAHRRAVVRFRACPGPNACPVTVIPRSELERAARRHPTVPETPVRMRVLVDGIAWVSETRSAVLLSIRISGRLAGIGSLSQIAFFENGRLADTQSFFGHGSPGLAASPRGSYVTQAPNLVVRRAGTQVTLPPYLRAVHSFAWTPDERYLALATRFAVTILDVASLERYDDRGSGLRSVTLPVGATRIEWR
jgi:hypothetical protein